MRQAAKAGQPVDLQLAEARLRRKSKADSTWAKYDRFIERCNDWLGRKPGCRKPLTDEEFRRWAVHISVLEPGQAVAGVYALFALSDAEKVPRVVREVVEGAKAQARDSGGVRETRQPITVDALRRYAEAELGLPPASKAMRLAYMLTAFRCLLRQSEANAMLREHVSTSDHLSGEQLRAGWVAVLLNRTKSDPEGKEGGKRWVQLEPTGGPTCPVAALRRHIANFDVCFPGPDDQKRPLWTDPVSGKTVQRSELSILARELQRLGGLEGGVYAGHSFRIGGATAMAAGGVPIEQIMSVGGWQSGAVHTYIRAVAAAAGGASERMGLGVSVKVGVESVLFGN
jgi:hypothetical protein